MEIDLRPSGARWWISCAAGPRASKDKPRTRSDAATEGTAAHYVFEHVLREDAPASRWSGHDVEVDGLRWTVDEEMVQHVQHAADYVRAFSGSLLIEQRLDLAPWIPGGSGTADCVVVADGVATLIDLKYGVGVRVFAKHNPQLMLYALGAYHAAGYLFDIDLFRLVIAQPRLDHFDEWEVTVRELLEWGESVVKPAVEAARGPSPKFSPSEVACRFCLAAPTCRALADHAMETARDAFRTTATLTNAEIGEILARAPLAEQFFDKLRAHAFAEITAGREVSGWKVVEGRSARAWSDEDTVAAVLRSAGATDDQIFVRKLISPTVAEKTLGRHAALECVVKPAGKPTLAPASDPRQAVDAWPENQQTGV